MKIIVALVAGNLVGYVIGRCLGVLVHERVMPEFSAQIMALVILFGLGVICYEVLGI